MRLIPRSSILDLLIHARIVAQKSKIMIFLRILDVKTRIKKGLD
jgi:hypothetical protein